MSIEVERKFVAAESPSAERLGAGVHFRQGYLAEDRGVTLRLRISDEAAHLTVKTGRGLARTEVEVAVDRADAEELWPHTAGRRIDKTRYRVPLGGPDGFVAEVDLFGGDLSGLCLVEVEFPSVEAAQAFDPPDWFGHEVTGEPAWSNAALARNGRPSTP